MLSSSADKRQIMYVASCNCQDVYVASFNVILGVMDKFLIDIERFSRCGTYGNMKTVVHRVLDRRRALPNVYIEVYDRFAIVYSSV